MLEFTPIAIMSDNSYDVTIKPATSELKIMCEKCNPLLIETPKPMFC